MVILAPLVEWIAASVVLVASLGSATTRDNSLPVAIGDGAGVDVVATSFIAGPELVGTSVVPAGLVMVIRGAEGVLTAVMEATGLDSATAALMVAVGVEVIVAFVVVNAKRDVVVCCNLVVAVMELAEISVVVAVDEEVVPAAVAFF